MKQRIISSFFIERISSQKVQVFLRKLQSYETSNYFKLFCGPNRSFVSRLLKAMLFVLLQIISLIKSVREKLKFFRASFSCYETFNFYMLFID